MKDIDGIKLDGLWRQREGLNPNKDEAKPAKVSRPGDSMMVEEPNDTRQEPRDNGARRNRTRKFPRGPKNSKTTKIILIVLAVLVVGGLGTAVVLQYQENQRLRDPAYVAAEADKVNNDLINQISRSIQLPDSTPVIYTVSDKEAEDAKQMAISLGATLENGDKILIYSEDKTFVVYRPDEDRVIKSGPVAITSEAADTEPTEDVVVE
jgi:hypothetical protein